MPALGFDQKDWFLTAKLFKMNLRDRYVGSVLGIYWAFLNPLIQLSVYTFVFGFVFKARTPGAETGFGYAVWLISGLVPWLSLTESLNVAANSVVTGMGLVKNVVFKIECVPVAAVLMGSVPFAIGMLFLTILLVIDGNMPTWHGLFILPVFVIQIFFLCGLGFILSAITVFIRDMTQLLTSILMILMFATPIFYDRQMLPPVLEGMTALNPFYHFVEFYRDILLNHRAPGIMALSYVIALSGILNFLGLKFFRRLKGYFESAL